MVDWEQMYLNLQRFTVKIMEENQLLKEKRIKSYGEVFYHPAYVEYLEERCSELYNCVMRALDE